LDLRQLEQRNRVTSREECVYVSLRNVHLRASQWSATTTGPDGKPVTVTGNNVEVVRRQPDGTWLFVIDNPRGAD